MAMNISVFAKPHIASSVFRKAFALANDDQQDRMAQFRTDVQSAYENISAIDRTALSADFTNTPESFNKVMGFCFVTLGEIFQEEFNADMTRGAMPQFAAITLVAVACFHTAISLYQKLTIIARESWLIRNYWLSLTCKVLSIAQLSSERSHVNPGFNNLVG